MLKGPQFAATLVARSPLLRSPGPSGQYGRPQLARSADLDLNSLLLLAQLRSADRILKRLILGVNRTYDGHHETDASDPKRTFDLAFALRVLSLQALSQVYRGCGG